MHAELGSQQEVFEGSCAIFTHPHSFPYARSTTQHTRPPSAILIYFWKKAIVLSTSWKLCVAVALATTTSATTPSRGQRLLGELVRHARHGVDPLRPRRHGRQAREADQPRGLLHALIILG